jgi:drug/metabolite transporter (DMT)-like permease
MSQPRRPRIAYPAVACLVAALLFGASTPAAKTLLHSLGPFTLAGLLYLGAAIAVAPFSGRGGSAALRRDPRQRRLLATTVIVGGGLGPVLLLAGLAAAPAASVSLWFNLEVVFTALIAGAFFRENLGARTLGAAALVFAGGALLAGPAGHASPGAVLCVALACLCWGFDNNLTAIVDGFTPAQITLAKGLGAGVVNLALGFVIEGKPSHPADAWPALAVGALGYGASIVLYVTGARQLGASRSQLIFATSPFLGVALAWTMLGEPVQPAQIAAAALMLGGIGLMLGARHEHEHTHEATTHTHAHRHDDGHHDHVHPELPAGVRHTHPHTHEPVTHRHPHVPDLHHRHGHRGRS